MRKSTIFLIPKIVEMTQAGAKRQEVALAFGISIRTVANVLRSQGMLCESRVLGGRAGQAIRKASLAGK